MTELMGPCPWRQHWKDLVGVSMYGALSILPWVLREVRACPEVGQNQ